MDQPAQQSPVSVAHNEAFMAMVRAAIDGWRAKHPGATESEAAQFGAKITARMKECRNIKMDRSLHSGQRSARRKVINEAIKKHGLKTISARRPELVEVLGRYFPIGISPTGGLTMAYRTEGDKTVIAAAICNTSDNFDHLAGRELAVERFTQGLTLTLDLSDIEQVNPHEVRKSYVSFLQQAKAALAS